MNDKNSHDCCSCKGGCCSPKQEKSTINIDFLYLDLSVCERCQGTELNLNDAINEVSAILNTAGYNIVLNKINITTKELAIKHEFLSSPTIRINGRDIALDIQESTCKECGELCGDNVDCRVWIYNGVEYNEPPKALIVNAILKEIYANNTEFKKEEYKFPDNLEVFFKGRNSN